MSAGGITALPFRKRRYNSYRINTNLGDVSGDTFTAICRTRPDEDAEVIFTFGIGTSELATGYLTIYFDATLVDIPQSVGYTDIKRVSGGSALPCTNRCIPIEFVGTTTP
jgi:hypothetical protein